MLVLLSDKKVDFVPWSMIWQYAYIKLCSFVAVSVWHSIVFVIIHSFIYQLVDLCRGALQCGQ